MATRKFGWKNLSFAHKTGSILSYVLYAVLAFVAFKDIRRRSPEEIHGSKHLWMVAVFMMTGIYGFAVPVTPLAYLLFGPKR